MEVSNNNLKQYIKLYSHIL